MSRDLLKKIDVFFRENEDRWPMANSVRNELSILQIEINNALCNPLYGGMWAVIDNNGNAIYCASWKQACHDYINDLLIDGLDDAKLFVVQEYAVVFK